MYFFFNFVGYLWRENKKTIINLIWKVDNPKATIHFRSWKEEDRWPWSVAPSRSSRVELKKKCWGKYWYMCKKYSTGRKTHELIMVIPSKLHFSSALKLLSKHWNTWSRIVLLKLNGMFFEFLLIFYTLSQ